MTPLGYQHLIDALHLNVTPLEKVAYTDSSVNRRMDTETRILFPSSVAIEPSLIGHLEFALKHEGVNLEVIDAAFEHIPPTTLVEQLAIKPTGEHIRRACFLWEWLTGRTLEVAPMNNGGYVDLFPTDEYYTAPDPVRSSKFRVRDNALGNPAFCPVVRRRAIPQTPSLDALLAQARDTLAALHDPELHRRAVAYLYLSETRSSYAIESETPSFDKQERFVQLLQRAGEAGEVNEAWLVGLQNVIVRDVYSQEASYRHQQNWLEDSSGRVSFFPAPADDLDHVMRGWESFINDTRRCPDLLVQAACAAFGFVYLHPFLDGNGRLHRFLIQHVLARSPLLEPGTLVPVSAVISKNIPIYGALLTAFSRPVTTLWDYRRGDQGPIVIRSPGSRAYRFLRADREVAFLHEMIKQAVQDEIPRELAYLKGYDAAFAQLNDEFDLPQKDLSALIRMIQSNNGTLSLHRRRQYGHLPRSVLDRIEQVTREMFDAADMPPES
ncbi:Fic family protein [Herbaspirillum sp. C7C2]|uniref:Fic family protein n=1 Tax=Herbaspirillum sp. C7C2 TaxID=2736666 RepID=UPI001F52A513|nr:Fic family protein [Herbaspirillum sp. C7C2]MCI1014102.1 Fic family protein [Herbaspirillum sp. C7C2]